MTDEDKKKYSAIIAIIIVIEILCGVVIRNYFKKVKKCKSGDGGSMFVIFAVSLLFYKYLSFIALELSENAYFVGFIVPFEFCNLMTILWYSLTARNTYCSSYLLPLKILLYFLIFVNLYLCKIKIDIMRQLENKEEKTQAINKINNALSI